MQPTIKRLHNWWFGGVWFVCCGFFVVWTGEKQQWLKSTASTAGLRSTPKPRAALHPDFLRRFCTGTLSPAAATQPSGGSGKDGNPPGTKASRTVHENVFLTRFTKETFGKVYTLGFFLPPKIRISISAGQVQKQKGNLACNTTCEIITPVCRLLKTKQQPRQLKSLISWALKKLSQQQ